LKLQKEKIESMLGRKRKHTYSSLSLHEGVEVVWDLTAPIYSFSI